MRAWFEELLISGNIIAKVTRRAYSIKLYRVIRRQGGASLKFSIKRGVEYFSVKKFNFEYFCTVVLRFDNFPFIFDDNDEHMQS